MEFQKKQCVPTLVSHFRGFDYLFEGSNRKKEQDYQGPMTKIDVGSSVNLGAKLVTKMYHRIK